MGNPNVALILQGDGGLSSNVIGVHVGRRAARGGVAWLFRQGLSLTPRRLGAVEVVSKSRVASLANPDASGRVLAGGGGAIAGAKTSEDATEEEHQDVTGRARALA